MIIAKTKVTSGFWIMIPKAIRDSQGIENGTNVIWYEKDGEINIHFRKAVKSIKEMRGSISGGKDLSKRRDKKHHLCREEADNRRRSSK